MQDTPEATLVAAHAYLLTTQPEPGDPRENMHQAAIKSLGLIREELKQKSLEKEATWHEQKGKEAKGPNIRKPEDPVHQEGETTRHKGKMQGTSLCRPGE
jgi:hypothetical protein